MIPILFEKTETSFTSNGLGRLADCIRCIVTEERNGIFECEFDYPVTGVLFSEIQEGRIIACTHDEQGDIQPFDIYGRSEPINGIVTFRAHHISYRLSEITVKPFTAGSCAEALQKIKSQSVNSNPFTFWTNKSVTANLVSDVPKNAKGMLVGEEGSILDVYGTGEYEYDKFSVKLYLHRGQDTNVSIRYGKNLIDYTNEYDTSDTYTAVVPYWLGDVTEGEETVSKLVMLPEVFISSGHSVPSGREVVVPMDLSDSFDDPPTTAQLRSLATSRLNNSGAWTPNQTVTVDFVQLWQTEEYADYAVLQRLRLCDTCGVFVPMYDTSLRAKVIRVVYNVLLDRYDEMELGDKPTTYTAVLEKLYNSKVAGVEAGLKSIAVDIQTVQNAAAADATAKANAAEQGAKNYADRSVSDLRDELETQIDAKIETWAQTSDPQTAWSDKSAHDKDLWLYTGLIDLTVDGQTIKPQGVYEYTFIAGGVLCNENNVDITDENNNVLEAEDSGHWSPYASTGNNLFDLADGKSTIFYGSPTGTYSGVDTGDYLVDKSDGSTYRYQGGAWVKQTDYKTYTDTEVSAAVTNAKQTIQQQYEQAIEDATELIRGGTGGYVVTTVNANGQPIELLITDNLNLNQAVNVWRWNQGGLAHSSNGYNGPFSDVAITADGKINASMILTGALTANLIKSGTMTADRILGGTLTLGGAEDAYGRVSIFGPGGENYGVFDANGIRATRGNNKAELGLYSPYMSLSYDGETGDTYRGIFLNLSGSPYIRIQYRNESQSEKSDCPYIGANWHRWTVSGTKYDEGFVAVTNALRIGSLSECLGGTNPFTVYVNEPYEGSSTLSGCEVVADYLGVEGSLKVHGGLSVTGTKNRLIKTPTYGDRLTHCYETPTPLFGDIGEAQLDADGICYVDIDDIFSETIELRQEYQVFLQKEGQGDCWIAEKHPRYFIIKGTPNLKVAWELKAKQRDYDMIRLEQPEGALDEYETITDEDTLLDSYINEQEALLYG